MKFKIVASIFFLFILILIASCASLQPQKKVSLKDYYIEFEQIEQNSIQNIYESPPVIKTTQRSIPILLIADNQTHDIFGGPAFAYRNKFADEIANCSIRPPHLDLFNYNSIILEEVLKKGRGNDRVILHLGDAANLSTTNEFFQFLKKMNQEENNWFMAPGNHDGFYFGMTNPFTGFYMEQWTLASIPACDDEEKDIIDKENFSVQIGKPMTKDKFVAIYLAGLLFQPKAVWSKKLSKKLDISINNLEFNEKNLFDVASQIYKNHAEKIIEVSFSDVKNSHLNKLSFYIHRDKILRGQSFVIQSIRIDSEMNSNKRKLYAIIADTCNYKKWMRFNQPIDWLFSPWDIVNHMRGNLNAGLKGQIGMDQIDILYSWSEQYKENGAQWVVVGHHPYKDLNLSWKIKSKFHEIIRQGELPLYLSAHTHKGKVRDIKKENLCFIELNIGSITDYPMVFKSLEFMTNESGSTTYLQAKNHTLINPDKTSDLSVRSYEDYRDYNRINSIVSSRKTAVKVKKILLNIFLDIFNKMEERGGYGNNEFKICDFTNDSENCFSYGAIKEEIGEYKNRLNDLEKDYNDDNFQAKFKKVQCFLVNLNQLIIKSKFFESDYGRSYAINHSIWASTQENDNSTDID